ALETTRAGNLFTTHTPVPAGFDRFPPHLMNGFMKSYAEERLHISLDDLLALGRQNPADAGEPFNMAYLAIRGSGAVNGVSRLHGASRRGLCQSLSPPWPQAEVPVAHVTTGVHPPSWASPEADALWTRAVGPQAWLRTLDDVEGRFRAVGDADLWAMRGAGRR